MKQTKESAGFYVESLLLLGVFIAVMLILLQCFSAAYRTRCQAKELNQAAILAKNAAEVLAEGGGLAQAENLLSYGNSALDGDQLTLTYDSEFEPAPQGSIAMIITETCETRENGIMYTYHIVVNRSEDGTEIYSLDTSVYQREDGAVG